MSRKLGSTLVALLVGLALIATAHAQVRFETTPEAFPCDTDDFTDEPCEVGITLRKDRDALVIVFVAAGTGTLPDASTGFAGEMPKDALDRVDTHAALNLCQSISRSSRGVVFIHEDVSLRSLAAAYRGALEDLGFTLASERSVGTCRTLEFESAGLATVRLAFTNVEDGVQVYLGSTGPAIAAQP